MATEQEDADVRLRCLNHAPLCAAEPVLRSGTVSCVQWLIGTLTIQATLPKGLALWPAIWMVPQSEHDGAIACRYLDSAGHCSWCPPTHPP
jgi:hypothetical protein